VGWRSSPRYARRRCWPCSESRSRTSSMCQTCYGPAQKGCQALACQLPGLSAMITCPLPDELTRVHDTPTGAAGGGSIRQTTAGPPGLVLSADQPGDGVICDTWLGLAMIAEMTSLPAPLGVTCSAGGDVDAERTSAATWSTGVAVSCPVISIRVA